MRRSDKSLVSLFGGARKRSNRARRRRVMVFGVFDGLHEGHRAFLRAAKKRDTELIVVVARDDVVRQLKNKTPRHTEKERRLAVERMFVTARPGMPGRAVLGDRVSGAYGIIKKYRPDIICLGYDQNVLAEDLEKKIQTGIIPKIQIRRIASHKPERMHSSLLTSKE